MEEPTFQWHSIAFTQSKHSSESERTKSKRKKMKARAKMTAFAYGQCAKNENKTK